MAVGPSLEIELDTYRQGPFLISLYVKGAMSSIIGSVSHRSVVANEFGESAFYDYKIDRLSYRIGTGARISWVPE